MAILNSGLTGLAGILPPKYMSAFMLGISLNAVGPIVLRALTLASFGLLDGISYLMGALVFFGVTSFFMGVCAYGVSIVVEQNVIVFNMAQTLEEKEGLSQASDEQ